MLDAIAKGSKDDLVPPRILGKSHDHKAYVVNDGRRDCGNYEEDSRREERDRRRGVADDGLHRGRCALRGYSSDERTRKDTWTSESGTAEGEGCRLRQGDERFRCDVAIGDGNGAVVGGEGVHNNK